MNAQRPDRGLKIASSDEEKRASHSWQSYLVIALLLITTVASVVGVALELLKARKQSPPQGPDPQDDPSVDRNLPN